MMTSTMGIFYYRCFIMFINNRDTSVSPLPHFSPLLLPMKISSALPSSLFPSLAEQMSVLANGVMAFASYCSFCSESITDPKAGTFSVAERTVEHHWTMCCDVMKVVALPKGRIVMCAMERAGQCLPLPTPAHCRKKHRHSRSHIQLYIIMGQMYKRHML